MEHLYRSINRDPRFHALQRRRSRTGWSLAGIVLGVYYGFILVIAFRPALFAAPLHEGTVVTRGVIAGLLVIAVSILTTGVYIWRANRDFDRANRQIVEDALHQAARPDA